jgi:hypothetical protein
MRIFVLTRNYAYFCTYAAYKLRESRKNVLRDHPSPIASLFRRFYSKLVFVCKNSCYFNREYQIFNKMHFFAKKQ